MAWKPPGRWTEISSEGLLAHSLGDGILPHVAPASVELHALVRDLVEEVRCPGGVRHEVTTKSEKNFIRGRWTTDKKGALTST